MDTKQIKFIDSIIDMGLSTKEDMTCDICDKIYCECENDPIKLRRYKYNYKDWEPTFYYLEEDKWNR